MKILNFGSLNIDNVYSVSHFIRPGETLQSHKLAVYCGGKGLNQSIALARAGAPIFHAGAVGASDGHMLLDQLSSCGIDTAYVEKVNGPSGHAIIQVNADGQNCILLHGGANQTITPSQIDETLSHFEAGDFLLIQNEINQLAYLVTQAKARGMIVFLNPSPITESLFELPFQLIDYFILNEIEASDLCATSTDPELLPELLYSKFPSANIMLTLGEKGSIFYDGINKYFQPIYSTNVVDTTAAGDTFTGFFIAGIAKALPLPDLLAMAAKAAAIAVSRSGAAPSIPTLAEVEQEL